MNRLIALLLLLCSLAAASAQTNTVGSVTLEWNANTETNLAGYIVRVGSESGDWTRSEPMTTATNHTVTNLTSGATYYVVVVAVDTDGAESDPSNQVSWTVARPRPPANLTRKKIRVTVNVTVKQ